jgi:hypothetical protein
MRKDKQGAEFAMSTIVIIVIVLIVLFVLLFIFGKGSSGFWGGVSSCEDRKGHCESTSESCTGSGGSVYRLGKCNDNQVCCIPASVVDVQNDQI